MLIPLAFCPTDFIIADKCNAYNSSIYAVTFRLIFGVKERTPFISQHYGEIEVGYYENRT